MYKMWLLVQKYVQSQIRGGWRCGGSRRGRSKRRGRKGSRRQGSWEGREKRRSPETSGKSLSTIPLETASAVKSAMQDVVVRVHSVDEAVREIVVLVVEDVVVCEEV